MKAVSVMLWELDDKDLSRLPADFPVLRYDTLHGSVSAIAAQTARASGMCICCTNCRPRYPQPGIRRSRAAREG